MGVKWNKTHSLDHEHILSGIIKCTICGTGLAGTVRRRKNKKSGEYKPSLNQDELNTDKINAVYGEHLTAQELYKVLEHFDDIYFKMSDLEKKEFFQNFIESITIYPDKKTNERIVDEIDFKFPIYYDDKESRAIRLHNETTVETVVSMSRKDTSQQK